MSYKISHQGTTDKPLTAEEHAKQQAEYRKPKLAKAPLLAKAISGKPDAKAEASVSESKGKKGKKK